MNTHVSGLTQTVAAKELGIDRQTLRLWTSRGVIQAKTWTSPLGRVYVGYQPSEVQRVRALLT